jgi:hypothetical protein
MKQFVKGYDCFRQRFPQIIGYDSGDTEIISTDQDPSTGYFFMIGTTNATELLVPGAN